MFPFLNCGVISFTPARSRVSFQGVYLVLGLDSAFFFFLFSIFRLFSPSRFSFSLFLFASRKAEAGVFHLRSEVVVCESRKIDGLKTQFSF